MGNSRENPWIFLGFQPSPAVAVFAVGTCGPAIAPRHAAFVKAYGRCGPCGGMLGPNWTHKVCIDVNQHLLTGGVFSHLRGLVRHPNSHPFGHPATSPGMDFMSSTG